ncbi:mannose-1-phosphate guanylyltransferase [Candidatus Falkowbacteria bacterium]|nr:mannose-1-phosphate guanylyltransferase [Candidatus Falkowbacteria bacterium]
MKAIILAGGSGTRLWPVSRRGKPKQIQPFLDRDTLLQKTFSRTKKIFPISDIIVSTGKQQARDVRDQLKRWRFNQCIVEPCKRDTAAAIGLVAVYLYHDNPHESLLTINSDHYIQDEPQYFAAVRAVVKFLAAYPDHTVLLGVRPTYPETGYGYIQKGKKISGGAFQVKRFVEKPDFETAKKYLNAKTYLWNPAVFAWRVDHLLQLYRRHLPQLHRILMKIESAIGTKREQQVLSREFARLTPISIDYGLMEKLTGAVAVVAGAYRFTDIGHWETLRSVLADERGNVIKGLSVVYDSSGNLIYNFTDRLVATAGLTNTIIVQTEDALFVCPRHRAADAKQVVKLLEQRGWNKFL